MLTERRAGSVLGQHRSTQRKPLRDVTDERLLTADIVELAKQYGRYGYRRVHGLLAHAGWEMSLSAVERIWRREGLKAGIRSNKIPNARAAAYYPALSRIACRDSHSAYRPLKRAGKGMVKRCWTDNTRNCSSDQRHQDKG